MSETFEEAKIVTLGGKGSSLSSSTVAAISLSRSHIRLDSYSLDRLSTNNVPAELFKPQTLIPKSLNPIETRAALVILLNKLLRCSNPTGIRTYLPNLISEVLNSGKTGTSELESVELTRGELNVVERSSPELYGICALVDHEASALGAVSGAVAALSCEAVKGDLGAFNLTDSGDGLVDKERVGVAGDMKVLLNGSKLVGKVESDLVSEIPVVVGNLREVVKLVHSRTRVELNSVSEVGKEVGGKVVFGMLNPLALALWELGESCLRRVKMNLDAVGDEGLRNGLVGLFEKKCPTIEELNAGSKLVYDSLLEKNHGKFTQEVNGLLGSVWRIVAWEGISAVFALEGGDLISVKGAGGVEINGEGVKGEKKGEKKKKKAILGKGTSQIVQLIKDKVQRKGGDSEDFSKSLEMCVEDLLLFLNPKGSEFDGLVNKVKEILESNESRRLPKLPKGTRDFAKEQMAIRERAFSIITEVFKRHGATALDTPAFELRETLMGKYGEDSKLIYDLADQGGELCSLRYDLTVPFARFVAMNGIMSFKRYQIAKVYRRDNPSKGRFREFYQCDFDIAGQYVKMGPDFEIVKILTELLDELDIGSYEVKLNHRKLLDGMLEICGVPAEKFRTICSSVDKLDKQSFEQVKKEMVEEKGLSVEVADSIGNFVKEKGRPKELLLKLKQEGSKFLGNASSKCALEDLEILFEALEKSKSIDKVVFDLSLARGLDYYTGVIFEAVFKGTTQVGSIAAGGRYDNLIGMFGTKQVPAVGVSLGIERVFTIMEQLQKEQNQTTRPTETQVLLSILGNESKLSLASELVSELWNAKVKAEYEISTRFSKHIDRARDSRIPWMVIVGDKELEKGIIKLKNLETTTEEEVPRSTFVEELKSRLEQ